MADFRETLEISRNNGACFMSYTWSWAKEDLAELDEDELQSPPSEIDWNADATIGEVADKIEHFCDKEDKVFIALQQLREFGKIKLVEEY